MLAIQKQGLYDIEGIVSKKLVSDAFPEDFLCENPEFISVDIE